MLNNAKWRRQFPGLARLPDPEARDIDAQARRVVWPAGANIFKAGEAAADLRMLVSGAVRVLYPSGRALFRVDAAQGCALVNSYLLADAGKDAEGWAERRTEAYVVPRALVISALARSPAFRAHVFQACADHIVNLRILIEEVTATDLEPRLARALCARSGDIGKVHVSPTDLSVDVGSSEAVVAGLLAEFQRRGWVSVHSDLVQVIDGAALARASGAYPA